MKVTIGKDGLKESFQKEFPETTKCHKCNGTARIAFVAHEGYPEPEGYVCDLHENDGPGGYWLHDACCVAVYFCKECFEAIALWNQG